MKKKNYRAGNVILSPRFKHIFKIMKLTLLFIVICASSLLAKESHSQSTKISVYANNLQAKEVINRNRPKNYILPNT